MTTTPAGKVTQAVKQTEAPLVGAPAEYLDGGIRSVDYTLKFPFMLEGKEYRVLTAHKLKGKDIFAMNRKAREKDNTYDPEVLVFAVMCKVSPRVIEELDAVDIKGLSEAAANFTPPPEEIPEKEPTGESGTNT